MAVLLQQGLQFRCHFGWEWQEEDKEGEKGRRKCRRKRRENEEKEKDEVASHIGLCYLLGNSIKLKTVVKKQQQQQKELPDCADILFVC